MMSSRARLLLLVTGLDTVIISKAVSRCAFRAEPGRSTTLRHISHIHTDRRCDGALLVPQTSHSFF